MDRFVKALMLVMVSGFLGLWLNGELHLAADDGTDKDQATLKERATLTGASWVAFSPDGKTLASSGKDQLDKTIKLWDTATGKELTTLKGHELQVVCFAFTSDGKTLASGSFDGKIKLWDVATGTENVTFKEGAAALWCLAFSPDGKTLASVGGDGINLWDASTGKKQDTSKGTLGNTPSHSTFFSPDLKMAALVTGDQHPGQIKLLEVTTGKEVSVADLAPGVSDGLNKRIFCVAFSPDGKRLASGSPDGTIKLWDVATGKEQAAVTGHSREVYCVVFSPDGKTLASAGDGGTRFWDVARGKELPTPKELVHAAWVAYSPDGKMLASSDGKGTVKLWEISPAK
jgi:WD40 repeat protein